MSHKDTIETIENSSQGKAPDGASDLVKQCYDLRTKDLSTFATEDLRLLISQNQALSIVVPMALEILRKDLLAEGDLYEGDLLMAVLTSDKQYWVNQPALQKELIDLLPSAIEAIETKELWNLKKPILRAFDEFKS